jgi:hypothetical protein
MYPKFHAVLKLSVNTANIFRRLPSLDRAALVIFSLHKMVKEHIRFLHSHSFSFSIKQNLFAHVTDTKLSEERER